MEFLHQLLPLRLFVCVSLFRSHTWSFSFALSFSLSFSFSVSLFIPFVLSLIIAAGAYVNWKKINAQTSRYDDFFMPMCFVKVQSSKNKERHRIQSSSSHYLLSMQHTPIQANCPEQKRKRQCRYYGGAYNTWVHVYVCCIRICMCLLCCVAVR